MEHTRKKTGSRGSARVSSKKTNGSKVKQALPIVVPTQVFTLTQHLESSTVTKANQGSANQRSVKNQYKLRSSSHISRKTAAGKAQHLSLNPGSHATLEIGTENDEFSSEALAAKKLLLNGMIEELATYKEAMKKKKSLSRSREATARNKSE